MLPNSVFDLASAPKASRASKAQPRPDVQTQKPAQAFQPMLEEPKAAPARPMPKPASLREKADAPAKDTQNIGGKELRADKPAPNPQTSGSKAKEFQPEPSSMEQTKDSADTKPDLKAQNSLGEAEATATADADAEEIASVASETAQTANPSVAPASPGIVSLDLAQVSEAEPVDSAANIADETISADGAIILPDAPIIPLMPIALPVPASDAMQATLQGQDEGGSPVALAGALLQAGFLIDEEGEDAALAGIALEGEGAHDGEAADQPLSGKSAAPPSPLLSEPIAGKDNKPGLEAALLKSDTALLKSDTALLKDAASQVAASSAAMKKDADTQLTPLGVIENAPADAKAATHVNGSEKVSSLVPQIGSRLPATEQIGAERFADLADAPYGLRGLGDLHQTVDRLLQDSRVQSQAMAQQQNLRPTPLQMLPIEIGMQAMRGSNSFQIRLDPAELGRVDVKLEVNKQGEVSAHLIVERAETLQMLRRDSTTLQYAFEQAGLKSSHEGLSFSLKGEGQNGQNQSQNGSAHGQKQDDDPLLKTQIEHLALRRVMIPHSSVDRVI